MQSDNGFGLRDIGNGPPCGTRWLRYAVALGLAASVVSFGMVLGLPLLRTHQLVQNLRQRGARLETVGAGPKWRQWRLNAPRFIDIGHADLSFVNVTNEDLAELALSQQLQGLTFHGEGISNNGLQHLLRMDALDTLTVIDCPAWTPEFETRLRAVNPGLIIERLGPAFFGIRGCDSLVTLDKPGVWVVSVISVVPGSPAQRAGIDPSDFITHFDGTATTDVNALNAAIDRHQPDDEVEVEVFRGGARQLLRVQLGRWR